MEILSDHGSDDEEDNDDDDDDDDSMDIDEASAVTNIPRLRRAPATTAPPSLSVVGTTPPQPTTTRSAVDADPSGSPQEHSRPVTPTETDPCAASVVQDDGVLGPEVPDHPDCQASPHDAGSITFNDLPTSAGGPVWMQTKKTLKYLHEAYKTRELSNLILHWYRLEESLGFPESVGAPTIRAARKPPNISQTPKGFPLKKRPNVITAFFKNGHNYRKDYALEARTLGAGTIAWWGEIKASNLYFGGPSGMYALIVLMVWWCSLLKNRPSDEAADHIRTLGDIDRTILSVINSRNPPPGESSPMTSTIAATPRPRGSKRATSEEGPSRKRLRSGRTGGA